MPPRGKESILRRQKEIARQQKAKEKEARRAEKKRIDANRPAGASKNDIDPADLVSLEELVGVSGEELAHFHLCRLDN